MCRTAPGGGGPGLYGTPGPASTDDPSPNDQVIRSGLAVTVTCSPRSATDTDRADGDGESQNHDAAPVSPSTCADGLASIRPGKRSRRLAADAASAAGLIGGAAGPAGGPGAPT